MLTGKSELNSAGNRPAAANLFQTGGRPFTITSAEARRSAAAGDCRIGGRRFIFFERSEAWQTREKCASIDYEIGATRSNVPCDCTFLMNNTWKFVC